MNFPTCIIIDDDKVARLHLEGLIEDAGNLQLAGSFLGCSDDPPPPAPAHTQSIVMTGEGIAAITGALLPGGEAEIAPIEVKQLIVE